MLSFGFGSRITADHYRPHRGGMVFYLIRNDRRNDHPALVDGKAIGGEVAVRQG